MAEKTMPESIAAGSESTPDEKPSRKHKKKKDKTDTDEEQSEKEVKASFKDFIRIFGYADRLSILLYLLAAIGGIAVGCTLPLMTLVFGSTTSSFNSFASGQGDTSQFQSNINHTVLYFIYLWVGRFAISYLASLCVCIAGARTTNNVRKAFLSSLLRQSVSHFDEASQGSVASQVSTNGNRINNGIAEKLYTMIQGFSLFLSSYVVALAVEWKLALITMSIIPLIFVIIGGGIAIDAPNEAKITRFYSQAGTLALDAIGSIKTLHAFGAQEKMIEWYDEFLTKAHHYGNRKSPIYGVIFSCQTFIVMSATALAFWEGHRLYASGEIPNVGTVFTVVLSIVLGASSIFLIIIPAIDITNAASSAAELWEIIDKESELDPLAERGLKNECVGDIEIRDLKFAYPSRPTAPVLQGLNLKLPAGKTTALVGPSGCGKSTIVGLLERWYQPTSGEIILDGHKLGEYNVKWLRSNLRLVQQEPTLFQGSVFENVSKGFVNEQLALSEDKQRALVREACIAADAHDFIERLPKKYDTELGERANMLSGGQRQRVSIARSILSNPKILVLDEATSALDPRAEKVVQKALNRVSENKTTLVIAHKLATVMAADNIAVMSNGRIIEQGNHKQLLDQNGLYAAMVRAQDLGEVSDDGAEHDDDDSKDEKRAELQRTQSAVPEGVEAVEKLTAGTVNYSLLRCLWILLKEHPDLYKWYLLMLAVYLPLGGSYPAQAIIFSRLIYVFTLTGSYAAEQANFYALLFFIVAIANLIGYFCIGWATGTIGQVLTHRIRLEMFERVLHFDQEFFDRPENSSGQLTARLNSVPSALQELMSSNVGVMVNIVITIVVCSIVGIAFGWKLGLTLTFAGLSVIVAAGYLRIRLDQKLETQTESQYTESAGLASEAVSSIRTVSLLTLESSVLDQYGQVLDDILTTVIKSLVITLIPYAFSQSVDFLVLALGFWYGSTLIASGEYSTTQFFVVFICIVFGGQNAAQFFQYTTSITKAKSSANYILWLRTITPAIRETDENRDRGPPDADPSIEVENVEFRYKQRDSTRVLKGLSMQIDRGTYAAFVGASGCGKSTIISLIQRFYDPTTGRIMLGDTDISTMSPKLWRQYMSLVQQEPPLYMGSVRRNITIGLNHEPSEEEIMEACRQANAQDFITSLPEGLNTHCGARGLQFSGGQRQRIAVARALIRKPRLLLLDEATSALDTQSERIVQKALDEAASSRTTIAVAHRLSTIRHANIIFVIDDGKIAEAGTHEELQQKKGKYFAMCLAQSLDQV